MNGPKSVCQVLPANSNVTLVSSGIKDGMPEFELMLSAAGDTFKEGLLCCSIRVPITSHELHELFF